MKSIITALSVFLIAFIAEGQTYHFSQFYSTPLLVNPATTGLTPGPLRVATNYRSQWNQSQSPYTTFTLSGDGKILTGKLAEGNVMGIGAAFVNDKTMNGAVQSNHLTLSTGYHISLDPYNYQSIGIGFQGTYNERRIDFSRLQFENQYGNGGYDPSLPNGEIFQGGKRQYFDVHAGAIYNYSLEDRSFFAGASVYNILKQEETYLTEQFKKPRLYSALAGGDIDIGVNSSFYFSGNFRQQANTSELTLGMAYGMFIDGEGFSAVRVGLWHRVNDAIIPYAGITYKGFQVGTSFDYTISEAKTRSQLTNTFEISLIYIAPDQNQIKRMVPWY